jgi:hypothetical protein
VACTRLGSQPSPETVEEQAQLCFRNIEAVLDEAGLGFADVVRINAFVTGREHLKAYMTVRDRFVGDPPPASTLMIVGGFSRPEFLVESRSSRPIPRPMNAVRKKGVRYGIRMFRASRLAATATRASASSG